METQEKRLNDLLKTISSIELILEDGNQNLKDCKNVLKELKKELFPKKENLLKRILRKIKL